MHRAAELSSGRAAAAAFEDAAPSQPLGARQLMDTVPRIGHFLDDLHDRPWPRRSARIASVLVQQAVRQENDTTTAFIAQFVEQPFRTCGFHTNQGETSRDSGCIFGSSAEGGVGC